MSEGGALGWWAAATLLLALQFALSLSLAAAGAVTRVTLHRMAADGGSRHAFLAELRQPLSSYRAAALVGRQLCLVGSTVTALVGFQRAGWSRPALAGALVAAVAGVLVIDLALSRLVAVWQPRLALRATAPFVHAAHFLLAPVVAPLNRAFAPLLANSVVADERREEQQEEEVAALIEVGEREGLLEATEGAMMRGIVDLDATRVREIMTPRTDLVALPEETTVAQARRRLLECGHSRLPVYRGTLDHVAGVLHARDLFRAWERGEEQVAIAGYLRPVLHVPEGMSAAGLLAEMRMKTKIAVVVDEFGGVSGLVTLEDLLEEIVGEIRDEHEQGEEELILPEPDGSCVVRAVAHVEELEQRFGVDFGERDYDTVGGLVFSAFGRIPEPGETVEAFGLGIQVLEADRRRVRRVRVRPLAKAASGAAS